MRPVAIIQARIGSTRLPGKVLARLANHNVLYYVIRRCQLSTRLEGVMVATTDDAADDPVVDFARSLGVDVFRGSEDDVLERYIGAASQAKADPIVRVTGDCPLIEPAIIDQVIDLYSRTSADYVYISGYPRGVDFAEVLTLSALQRAFCDTRSQDRCYREHVMTYIEDHPERFKLVIQEAPEVWRRQDIRLCIDEAADLEVVRRICEHFAPRVDFSLSEIMAFLDQHPEIATLNRHVKQRTR